MKRMRVRVNDDWYDVEIADLFQNPVEVVVDGEPYMVDPGTVHRIEGMSTEPAVILEVSTPELEDVVRLQDDYGR